LKIDEADGKSVISLNKNNKNFIMMSKMFDAWREEAQKWFRGEISKEEYDQCRYSYPKLDTSGMWHNVGVSEELSVLLTKDLMKDKK